MHIKKGKLYKTDDGKIIKLISKKMSIAHKLYLKEYPFTFLVIRGDNKNNRVVCMCCRTLNNLKSVSKIEEVLYE